jgi:hypothetical protein
LKVSGDRWAAARSAAAAVALESVWLSESVSAIAAEPPPAVLAFGIVTDGESPDEDAGSLAKSVPLHGAPTRLTTSAPVVHKLCVRTISLSSRQASRV